MNNISELVQFKTECIANPELKGVFQRMIKTGLAFLELQYKTAQKLLRNPEAKLDEQEGKAYEASRQSFLDAKFALLETGAKKHLRTPSFTLDGIPAFADSKTHE